MGGFARRLLLVCSSVDGGVATVVRAALPMLLVLRIFDRASPCQMSLHFLVAVQLIGDRGIDFFQGQRGVALSLNAIRRISLVEDFDHPLDGNSMALDPDRLRLTVLSRELLEYKV